MSLINRKIAEIEVIIHAKKLVAIAWSSSLSSPTDKAFLFCIYLHILNLIMP